jgi:hypothetical protein
MGFGFMLNEIWKSRMEIPDGTRCPELAAPSRNDATLQTGCAARSPSLTGLPQG